MQFSFTTAKYLYNKRFIYLSISMYLVTYPPNHLATNEIATKNSILRLALFWTFARWVSGEMTLNRCKCSLYEKGPPGSVIWRLENGKCVTSSCCWVSPDWSKTSPWPWACDKLAGSLTVCCRCCIGSCCGVFWVPPMAPTPCCLVIAGVGNCGLIPGCGVMLTACDCCCPGAVGPIIESTSLSAQISPPSPPPLNKHCPLR